MTTISSYKVWAPILLMLAVSACVLSLHISQKQHESSQDHISRVLEKLQSRDESDVVQAKVEIDELGDEAIAPLVNLLRTLITGGRYSYGMAPADEQQQRPIDKQNTSSLDDATRSRVINDIYEALGRLHTAEAVPLLVSIMENEEIADMIQGMSPVMRALADIGPAAVPALIESLDESTSKALASADVHIPDPAAEERERTFHLIEGRIQERGILVLRKIGDKRAIPAIERAEASTDNQFIRKQAREALQTIRTK